MNFPTRLRRTILCLPFIFSVADRADAAPALEAGAASGAQRVSVSLPAFERCDDIDIVLGEQRWRIVCERIVAAPGVRYWEGHVAAAPDSRVNLQIRPEGINGLLDLPARPLRLGVVDGGHWLLDTPADALRAELASAAPPLFLLRETAAGEAWTQSDDAPLAEHTASDAPAPVAYPVTLNLAELAAVEPGAQVDLSLPGLQQTVTYERTSVSPDGTSTWSGYLSQYGRDYAVVLTYGVDGSATGTIQGPSGEWLITGRPGQTWIVDTAASDLRHNPGAKDDDAVAPPAAAGRAEAATAGATSSSGTASTTPTSSSTASNSTLVDVLVLYTPGMVARYGGDSGVATRIDHFIALANQAYANGGIGITLRRVGLQRVDIADNISNGTTLDQLRRASGVFASIPALRNSTGADGVLLVRPFDLAGQGGNCGVGYVGGYGGTAMSVYSEYAYAVVSEGRDVKGQPYYCTDTTFAHELGHNMGLMHDRATVAKQGGGTGALPYAFGYGKSGQFGTIMSYMYPVVVRFSNPLDLSCSSGPCGVASTDTINSADNARALGITRSAFSAYRGSTTAAKVSVAGIVTIDGKAAANVKILANGTQCAVTGASGAYACSFASGWSGTIAASASSVSFTPPSASYTDLRASTSRNFAGVTKNYTISGTVSVRGVRRAGVSVTAGGVPCGVTNYAGLYSCIRPQGWSGRVLAPALSSRVYRDIVNLRAATRADLAIRW